MTDWKIIHADALETVKKARDAGIDAIVTDPPYELGFMGKKWDGTGIADSVEFWRECLRVLKPGGHLLAFGGTRTYHRMAVAIEDAGFEIRDSIMWVYGSGFPKSLDVSKAIDKAAGAEREITSVERTPFKTDKARERGTAYMSAITGDTRPLDDDGYQLKVTTAPATDAARQWQGWGTALKPSHEPIVVARKTLVGTVAANVQEYGTGALNIDGCRVEASGRPLIVSKSETSTGIFGDGLNGSAHGGTTNEGRWPTNLVLSDDAAKEMDRQSGNRAAGAHPANRADIGYHGNGGGTSGERVNLDSGGASRFFPVFKYQAKAPKKERPVVVTEDGRKITHPTVKPVALMRWLVRLVTPPGGVVLDPFAGTGTTLEAAHLEGFRSIGIEADADSVLLIKERMSKHEESAA